MLFTFKHYVEDFFVEELLWFDLKGSGDVFFVQFEKTNMNTMDVIHHLCKKLNIERKNLWISGLKDKFAVTRQRVGVYKTIVEKIWWTEVLLSTLGDIVKVIQHTWHNEPLAIGKHKANHFQVVLRFRTTVNEELKSAIEYQLKKVAKNWFPNCFGQQRFGKGNRNFKRARDILTGNKNTIQDDFEIRFKLQAFSSMYFNHYILERWKKGLHIMEGDILTNTFHTWKAKVGIYAEQKIHLFDYQECKKQYTEKDFFDPHYYTDTEVYDHRTRTPTGLILGYNMLLCPNGSKAFFKDWELIKKSWVLEHMETMKKYQLWGIRRPLWIIPQDFNFQWDAQDWWETPYNITKKTATSSGWQMKLSLSFTLPTGVYATVLLWTIFENIDTESCIQNKLLVPDEII